MYQRYGVKKRKRDANAAALAQLARSLGMEVIDTQEPADYLVGLCGLWIPVEVKNLEGRAKGRRAEPAQFQNGREKKVNQLTDQQGKLRDSAARAGAPFWIWYRVEDVQLCFELVKSAGRLGALQAQAAIAMRTAHAKDGEGTTRTTSRRLRAAPQQTTSTEPA